MHEIRVIDPPPSFFFTNSPNKKKDPSGCYLGGGVKRFVLLGGGPKARPRGGLQPEVGQVDPAHDVPLLLRPELPAEQRRCAAFWAKSIVGGGFPVPVFPSVLDTSVY